jgi:sec-independent protein translocase protein TatA
MLNIILFLDSLGGGEILLIMVFILLFFGSSKIPDLAKGLGRGMREFKDAMNGVQQDIEKSIRDADIKKEIKQVAEPAKDEPAKKTEEPGV